MNLARSGTFLAPSAELPGTFEYHPLVRDLLRARLQAEASAELPGLHRAAVSWLVDHGQPAAAIPHAAAAGDWEQAAALAIETMAVDRLLGPDAGLGPTFAGMPADIPGPAAATVQAALACSREDPDACAKHLLRARELVGDGPSDGAWTQRLAVAVIEAVCGSVREDMAATLAAASVAEAMFSEAPSGGVDVSHLRAVVLSARARVLLLAGRLEEAAAAASAVLRATEKPGCEHLRVTGLVRLALVEALRGRLSRADSRAREAVTLADQSALAEDSRAVAEVALAWVHAERYDLRSAIEHADRASLGGGTASDPVATGMLALVRARLCRAHGALSNALAELNRVTSKHPTDMPSWLRGILADYEIDLRHPGAVRTASAPPDEGVLGNPWRVVLRAWAMVAVGETGTARDLVAPLRQQPNLPIDVQVSVWLVTAMGQLAEGRRDLARDALNRGLELAEPEQQRRPVLEAPARLRRFIRKDPRLAERHPWLTRSSTGHTGATAVVAAGPPQPVVEPLTNKEREVLRLLASLLSTDEIARAMLVSVNTVRTHVRGVLRKLAVSRRNDAVRRARELGLI
jgi:LuxR family maltose regulon positive regulatory protein